MRLKFKTLWLSGVIFRTNLHFWIFIFAKFKGCKSVQCAFKEHLKPKPSYKAFLKIHFELKQTYNNFSAKNKECVSEPSFTKSERKVRFGQFFLKMILSTEEKKFYLFRKMVKNAKWWSKSNLPHSQTANFTLLKKRGPKVPWHGWILCLTALKTRQIKRLFRPPRRRTFYTILNPWPFFEKL